MGRGLGPHVLSLLAWLIGDLQEAVMCLLEMP